MTAPTPGSCLVHLNPGAILGARACGAPSREWATCRADRVNCPQCRNLMALAVMVLDRRISGYLRRTDPKAYQQAADALRAFPAMDIDNRIAQAAGHGRENGGW